jgi:photosystem II stability/assembly factor-like uncharacterized protein
MKPDMKSIAAKIVAARLVAALLLSLAVWLGDLHGAEAGVNEWTTNGPEGAAIGVLAIDPHTPTTLYASTSVGVFKSTDGGGHWSAVDVAGHFLAIDPQTPTTLYAGGAGIFKSTDGGATWSAVNSDLTGVGRLVIDPQTPTTLYASIWNNGVFKSTDGGVTWSASTPA